MRHIRRRALAQMSGIFLPVRPTRGGWHRADPGDGGGDGSAGGGPAGGGANDDADDDGEGDDVGKDSDDKLPELTGEFDAEKAQRAISAARAGEKKARDRVAAILKAAGLTPEGKEDPEQVAKSLMKQLNAEKELNRTLVTREAVRDAATKHSANVAELLDSTKFLAQLKELDPAAEGYGAKVAKLVEKAVKDNPAKYGTTPAKGGSGRSGSSDHTGGNGGRQRPGLGAAIAARMNQ